MAILIYVWKSGVLDDVNLGENVQRSFQNKVKKLISVDYKERRAKYRYDPLFKQS